MKTKATVYESDEHPPFIRIGGKLVAVEVVNRHPTGSKTVRLLADCGAYRIGDKVNVGPGQFIKDDQ